MLQSLIIRESEDLEEKLSSSAAAKGRFHALAHIQPGSPRSVLLVSPAAPVLRQTQAGLGPNAVPAARPPTPPCAAPTPAAQPQPRSPPAGSAAPGTGLRPGPEELLEVTQPPLDPHPHLRCSDHSQIHGFPPLQPAPLLHTAPQSSLQTPAALLAGRQAGWQAGRQQKAVPCHMLYRVHLAGFVEGGRRQRAS